MSQDHEPQPPALAGLHRQLQRDPVGADAPLQPAQTMKVSAPGPRVGPYYVEVDAMTKQDYIDYLVQRRQDLGGSVSEHNHRRLLESRTKADLEVMYQRIRGNEARSVPPEQQREHKGLS